MKALVPSGGAGTRLRPITHTSAKQLVPVANRPILFSVLDDIAEAGIVEVGIVVGDTGDEIRAAVGTGEHWGLRVTYIAQESPRGLAHTVLIAREYLGEDPFVMYLGDNMLRDGICGLVEAFATSDAAAQILVTPVADPRRYGVVELDGDRVVRLVEKPAVPPSDLALVGVYMFDARVHEAVRAIEPSGRGELEITDAIQVMVDRGWPVRVHHVQGWWKDTGRIEDLLDANRLVLETAVGRCDGSVDSTSRVDGAVIVEEGAEIIGSVLRGPLIVGKGARIVNASLKPFTAIGAGCVVEDSEIEHSIIMEQCTLSGVRRMEDSLLGRGVDVRGTPGSLRTYRLMVGDHGRVDIS